MNILNSPLSQASRRHCFLWLALLSLPLLPASHTLGATSVSVAGVFVNPVGPPGMNVTGVGTRFFAWGVPFPGSGSSPSHLAFNATANPISAEPNTYFSVGFLSYHNGVSVRGTEAESVDLKLTITIPSAAGGAVTKTLQLVTTINTSNAEESADRVIFPASRGDVFFEEGGVKKRLTILGFGTVSGSGFAGLRQFNVLENGDAGVQLIATIRNDCEPGGYVEYADLLTQPCGDTPADVLLSQLEDDMGNRILAYCKNIPGFAAEYRVYYVPVSGKGVLIGRCPFEQGCNSGIIIHSGDLNGNGKPDCFITSRFVSKDQQYGDADDDNDGKVDWWVYVYDFINGSLTRSNYHVNSPAVLVYSDATLFAGEDDPPPTPRLRARNALPMRATPFLVGDLNEDGKRDATDRQIFEAAFGSCQGQPNFVIEADVDGNECIDEMDRLILFGDRDHDGVLDRIDKCPDSDLRPTVVIGNRDTGVANDLMSDGCTIADLVAKSAVGARNHGQFVSRVAHLTNDLKNAGIISAADKGAIQSAAAQSR